jgi:RNA polymerase sigma factor (sigma-70 family)
MRPNPWPLIRRLARRPVGESDPVSDAELLARFVRAGDQTAFELLVWRHGPMVLGACRRILRDVHLAEDAFQAAFLILARKAGSVRSACVAGWLHRVARRVAVRAARPRKRIEPLTADPLDRPAPDAELRVVLDAEIDRLPERFRLPVVLCYLDGRTTEDAARLLGVPRGTVLSRLATARQRHAARLTRRGVTLPAGGLFGVGWAAGETVSAEQVGECVSAAMAFVAGGAGAGVAFQLASGVIQMGTRKVIAAWATALVVAAGLTTGVGVTTGGPKLAAEAPPVTPTPAVAAPPATPKEDAKQAREDEQWKRIRAIEERKKRLREMKAELDARSIKNLKPELAKLVTDTNPTVLKALSDVYTQAELTAFQTQLDVSGLKHKIADLKERIRKTEAAPISMEKVEQKLDFYPESIRLADEKIQDAKMRLEKTITKQNDSTTAVQQLRDELKQLRAARVKAFEAIVPEVKQLIVENETRRDREALAVAETELKIKQARLADLDARRKELRRSIEQMARQSADAEPLKAALQNAREQSQRLGREILELDVQRSLVNAPPIAPAEGDKLDRILSELTNLRAEVRRLQEQKK